MLPSEECPLPGLAVEHLALAMASINSTMSVELIVVKAGVWAALLNGTIDVILMGKIGSGEYDLVSAAQTPVSTAALVGARSLNMWTC